MTYEQKEAYLKTHKEDDDIFVIMNCVGCDGPFYRLKIDINRGTCYNC